MSCLTSSPGSSEGFESLGHPEIAELLPVPLLLVRHNSRGLKLQKKHLAFNVEYQSSSFREGNKANRRINKKLRSSQVLMGNETCVREGKNVGGEALVSIMARDQ